MLKSKEKQEERMIEYFLNEIKRQCEYVNISKNILKSGIENGEANLIFYSLHNMFTAFGNISKILYPGNDYRQRGKSLREKLEIQDTSQFHYQFKNEVVRKYRNILEHYDEHFEDWFKKGDNSIIVDCNMGAKNMIKIEGFSSNKYLRNYDPIENKFTFLDNEYELNTVMRETIEIYEKIKKIEGDKFAFARK